MQTNILNPMQLFQFNIRYTIPTFQRRYVWEQEEQWEPLWDDVRNTAETYLEEMEHSGNNPLAAANNTPAHFLGAVVIQQVPVSVMEIQRREVIDGQQRMTTLQLLLDAVQQVFEEVGLASEAANLSQFVTNNQGLVEDKNHIFKLWPTSNDREAFRRAMDNGLATDEFEDSLIVQAHEFFQMQVRQWLGLEPNSIPDHNSIQRNAMALQTVITAKLQMVVIDCDTQDDPHLIFETLNARGTPLLESELVKNYVVSRTDPQGDGSVWGDFDDTWWRSETGRGNQRRPRIDTLLGYWLTTNTASEVSPTRVFREFRRFSDDRPICNVMSEVQRDLGNYRRFELGPWDQTNEVFRYRLDVMNIRAITPALLLIFSATEEQRVRSLKALESFLIRRMAYRGSTRDYGRLTLGLVEELRESGLDNAGRVVVDFLRRQTAESREWPNDGALEQALVNLPLYRLLTRGRLRLLLEGVEEQLRKSSKAEEHSVPKSLTIEHVMPRSWGANWPLPDCLDDDERMMRANNRNRLIHTLGNLTLISGDLNSTLSNAAWEGKCGKRETLGKHFVLHLNKDLLDESRDTGWDEDFIQARSKSMAKLVSEVWPGPDSPVWD